MSFLGCPRYLPLGRMNWAPILGLCQEPERFTGSAYKSSFNPASWACDSRPVRLFFKPNQHQSNSEKILLKMESQASNFK